MITQDYLHEFFHYDSETGVFSRKKRTGKSTTVGEIVGSDKGNGYLMLCLKSRLYLAHRIAWLYVYGEMPSLNIDHINGKRADNRICNLRLANQSQNIANAKLSKANTSGFKGVTWNKSANKWNAQLMLNYKRISLGNFEKKEDAAEAYKKGAVQYFGEYAHPL
jgi:hypothetical protein